MSKRPFRSWSLLVPVILAGLAGCLALAFALDRFFVDVLAQPISSGQCKAFLRAMRCWGEAPTLLTLGAAIVVLDRARWKQTAVIVLSVVISAGIVDVVKPIFARPRPSEMLAGESAASRNSSFPSGHTATAFAFARGVTLAYPPLRPVCLFAASGTALSRMYEQRHFLSDCVAGAIMGWFIAGGVITLANGAMKRSAVSAPESIARGAWEASS